MDLQLTGKKALVSAGHKGVGNYIAQRLLEEGASVAICCREQEDLDTALDQLNNGPKNPQLSWGELIFALEMQVQVGNTARALNLGFVVLKSTF